MKIAVIGPIEPFRGGIAKSTTILCKNLSQNHEVIVFSFKRLYPGFLYKGKSQKEEVNPPKELKASFELDSVNPVSWLNVVAEINAFNPDIVLFEWWTPFFAPCFVFIARKLKQKNRVAIIQNVCPHEGVPGSNWLSKQFFKQMKRFVVLGKTDKEHFEAIFGLKADVLIEPAYFSSTLSQTQARKELGLPLSEKIVLFFGLVREYKRPDLAIDCILKSPGKLYFVGEWWINRKPYDFMLAGTENKVLVKDCFVSQHETELWFRASNVALLPYDESSESAVIQTALGYGLPMIVSNKIGNAHLVEEHNAGIIVTKQNPEAYSGALKNYFEYFLEEKFKMNMTTETWTAKKEKLLLGMRA